MFYEPQVAHMNKNSPQELSLDLTLTLHPCDGGLESQKVRLCLKVKPFRTRYYQKKLNFCTLGILLQVDPAFGNEPKIVFKNNYETKDISIFGIRHYC